MTRLLPARSPPAAPAAPRPARRASGGILATTSSFGPNICTRPRAMTISRSTPASALPRCAMTMAMPPRARTPRIASRQRLLAFGIEVGVRLVEHDQERLAIERARKRNPLPLPGRQRSAAFADIGLIALGQTQDEVVHAGRLGGRNDRVRHARPARSGRCSAPPCRPRARHPAADSRYAGRARSAAIVSSAAPSMRTVPRAGGHTPTSARARHDCPPALGPMMPRPLPFSSAKRDILHDQPLVGRAARR